MALDCSRSKTESEDDELLAELSMSTKELEDVELSSEDSNEFNKDLSNSCDSLDRLTLSVELEDVELSELSLDEVVDDVVDDEFKASYNFARDELDIPLTVDICTSLPQTSLNKFCRDRLQAGYKKSPPQK